MSMNELEKERLEVLIKDMSIADLKWLVMLVPARTDTKRFHKYILPYAEIRFLKGRLTFVGAKDPAPFPNMVVIFRPEEKA